MDNIKDDGPVPGGGPREGEEAPQVPNPNPDAVGPDFPVPGESRVITGEREEVSVEEDVNEDEESDNE